MSFVGEVSVAATSSPKAQPGNGQTHPASTASTASTASVEASWSGVSATRVALIERLDFSSALAYPTARVEGKPFELTGKPRSQDSFPSVYFGDFQIATPVLTSTAVSSLAFDDRSIEVAPLDANLPLPTLAQAPADAFPTNSLDLDDSPEAEATIGEGDPELGEFRLEPIVPPP
ncbi:MAG: hypothetical protein AAFZ49_01070, partial [Cyanobacteria bacterium J06659_2]